MTTADDLAKKTVKDLRSLASQHKILGRTRMKKDELVAALSKIIATPRPELPTPTATTAASSPGSSTSAPASVAPQTGPEQGLPIPDTYGHDRLVIMAQDPHHVFAYWELSGPAHERALAEAGDGAVPVIIVHSEHGTEQRSIDLAGGNYYLSVAADAVYHAQLALRSADGRLIILVESNSIRTPAATPSQSVDEEWMAIDGSFEELLVQAGLPGGIGSSATLSNERTRSRLWHALVSSPLGFGSSEQMPSSRSSSSLLAH